MNKNVLVILGPTSSGKTKLAVKLAKKFSGEIISADSRQVYQGMDVGTGKDLAEYIIGKSPIANSKLVKIPYHLIDIVSPKKDFSVVDWQRLANKAIEDILKRGRLPIICGGTGLYISALVEGYQFPKAGAKNKALRIKLDKLSLKQLLVRLKKVDPETYEIIDRKNRRRVGRALEIYYQTGEPKSQIANRQSPKSKYQFLILGLTFPKDVLRQRIAKRLKDRLEKEGMVEEVKKLHQKGVSWKKLESFGLEYKFVALYLQKKLSYEEMQEQLERAIAQFAKRQMTWFSRQMSGSRLSSGKRDKKIKWIKNYSDAVKLVKEKFKV